MVLTSSSSSSSCTSFTCLEEVSLIKSSTIKFVCSYGGRIVPRYPDGKLRYVGGDTRVLAVNRLISFSELQKKLKDLCGCESCDFPVNLRCPLPADDLDALISVTSDEDLANLIEEYDLANTNRILPLKIRVYILFPFQNSKNRSIFSFPTSAKGKLPAASGRRPPVPAPQPSVCKISEPVQFAGRCQKVSGQLRSYRK